MQVLITVRKDPIETIPDQGNNVEAEFEIPVCFRDELLALIIHVFFFISLGGPY